MGGEGVIIPLGSNATKMKADLIGVVAVLQLAIRERRRRKVHICSNGITALTTL